MSTPPNDILTAALEIFREQGYNGATLSLIASRSRTDLNSLAAQYPDKSNVLAALLAANSPLDDLLLALDSVEGDNADDIVRDAMRRMVKAFERHEAFIELAALDMQANNGAFLAN